MDEILLYLSLKNSGHGMQIYDSLQKREQFSVAQVEKTIDEVDCSFVTLIDNKYVENLKSIYKPPFGIYCYGNYNLLNQKTLTIFADKEQAKEIQELAKNDYKLLGVNPSNKKMKEVLEINKTNNIFFLPELKKSKDKTYQDMLINQDIIFDNAFVSEIWEKDNGDYSNQADERLYLGLTKQVLVLTKLTKKQILAIANYSKNEDIKVMFAENTIDNKDIELFKNAKFKIVKLSNLIQEIEK